MNFLYPYLLLWIALLPSFANAEVFSDAQLCQAAIATNNGHKAKAAKVISSVKHMIEVEYLRPEDKKRFRFLCKVEPLEIRWQDEYIGHWAQNLRVYYKVNESNKTLEIRSVMIIGEETSAIMEKFTLKDF